MLIQADDVEAQLDRSTCFFYRATQHDKAPNHQIKKTTRFFFPTNQPPEYSIKLDFAWSACFAAHRLHLMLQTV